MRNTIGSTGFVSTKDESVLENKVSGGFAISGTLEVKTSGSARFYDNDETYFVGFHSPTTLSANQDFTLPSKPTTSGLFLTASVDGVMGWNTSSNSESTSGSNLGTGTAVYSGLSGNTLQFKTLVTGTYVSMSNTANNVTVNVTGLMASGSSVGTGTPIYKGTSGDIFQIFSLEAPLSSTIGSSLFVTSSGNNIQLSRRKLSNTLCLEDDFVTSTGCLGWETTLTGSGAAVTPDVAAAGQLGLVVLDTGTWISGGVALHSNTGSFEFSSTSSSFLEWYAVVDTLSDSDNRYVVQFGWIDTPAAGDQTNGIYFEYNSGSSGDFWNTVTSNNGVQTRNTSATAVGGVGFRRYLITCVSGAVPEANFYINDVLVDTITTNLPATSATYGFGAKIEKQGGVVGTTPKYLVIDYVQLMANLATAR